MFEEIKKGTQLRLNIYSSNKLLIYFLLLIIQYICGIPLSLNALLLNIIPKHYVYLCLTKIKTVTHFFFQFCLKIYLKND